MHPSWQPPPTFPPLAPGEIHVWRIPLQCTNPVCSEEAALLSADELRRAERFLMDRHRVRFVAGRARLRVLLAWYLGLRPRELEFRYEAFGKPGLVPRQNVLGLQFNFSNSHTLGLLAVSPRRDPLGADVEQIRELHDLTGLAKRFFDPSESEALFHLADGPQRAAFFRLWTRKEAFLKAVGKGLTFPLNEVVVSLGESAPPRIVTIQGDAEAAAAWHLFHLIPDSGYIAAVAHQGETGALSCWSWTDRLMQG